MAKRSRKPKEPEHKPEPDPRQMELPEASARIMKRIEKHTGPLTGQYKTVAEAIIREIHDPTDDEKDAT